MVAEWLKHSTDNCKVAGWSPTIRPESDVVYTSSFGRDVMLSFPGYWLTLAIWVTSLATLHGGSHREKNTKIRLIWDGLCSTFATSPSLLLRS